MSNKTYPRTLRIADLLQQEIARVITIELRDPRFSLVSVTAVNVSRDASHAIVFIDVLNQSDAELTITALNHASGFIRHELAKRLEMRSVPKLRFNYDLSILRGEQISKLIDDAE